MRSLEYAFRQGAASLWLWQDGQAPPLYHDSYNPPNPNTSDRAPVTITNMPAMAKN